MNRRKASLLLALSILTITMVSTVYAAGNVHKYSDISSSDWYYEGIQYVCEKGLMQGTSASAFDPNITTTRGMIVTILYRLEGTPSAVEAKFTDIKAGQYYSNAVAWATESNIAGGYGDGRFGPNDNITREQLAAILYRYAEYKKYAVSARAKLGEYKDANAISGYAVDYMSWANAMGLITGETASTLNPKGYALRGQVAVILKRFCENIAFSEKESSGDEAQNTPEDNLAPAIYINDVTATPGEKNIEIPILIKNNPGILGMTLSVSYNENVMSMKSAINGEAVSDVLILTHGKMLGSGCRFIWDGLEISPENVKNGAILLMKFSISDNALSGSYPIVVTYDNGDIVDNKLVVISPVVSNGHIAITK